MSLSGHIKNDAVVVEVTAKGGGFDKWKVRLGAPVSLNHGWALKGVLGS